MRRYRKMIVTFFLPAVALLGASALVSGCAHDQSSMAATRRGEQGAANPSSTGASGPEATTQAANGPMVADPNDAEKLTDDKIINVAHVAHEGEMQQAKLAAKHTADPRVRAFANEMLREHRMADMKGDKVAAADSLQPASSATSDKLERDAAKTYEDLAQKRGVELDRAYITAQVDEHSAVLKLLDERLIPQASTQSVKNVLQQLRPDVAKHLEQALMLQTKLKE